MPKRNISELFSQKGSVLVMALLIFLIISVLATSIISVAAMENKMTLYDTRREQARLAADAGVEVARNVILNYLGAGKSIPADITDVAMSNRINNVLDSSPGLGDGRFAKVTIDASKLSSDHTIKITSRGRLEKSGEELAHRTAAAQIFINVLPNMAVQTEEFKILGKYYTEFQFNPISLGGGISGLLPLHGSTNEKCSDLSGEIPDNPNHYFWFIDYKYLYNLTGIPYMVDWSHTRGHTIPYWQAQGKVNIRDTSGNPAKVAINHWGEDPESELSVAELEDLFYKVDMEEQVLSGVSDLLGAEYHRPARNLNSYDFIGDVNEIILTTKYPVFGAIELQRYRELAQKSAINPNGKWAYLTADNPVLSDGRLILDEVINSANPNYIGRPCIFIDLDPNDTLLLDFRTYNSSNITIPDGTFVNWSVLEPLFNDINNRFITFVHLVSNDLNGITIVTPASIDAGYDSMLFKPITADEKETALALFSGRDITFRVDPKLYNNSLRVFPDINQDYPQRKIRTYLLAGKNVNISSTTRELTIEGVISSTEKVTVKIDYFDLGKVTEMHKLVHIINDPSVIKEFPEPWAYMGIGKIISYKYTD